MIRPADIDDLDEINALLLRARLVEPGGARWCRRSLPCHTYVAGRPVSACGAVLPRPYDAYGWLVAVAVDPAQRRQGQGRAMVERLCAVAASLRLSEAWLETMFWNIGFYRACGFEHVPAGEVTPAVQDERINPRCCFMRRRLLEETAAGCGERRFFVLET